MRRIVSAAALGGGVGGALDIVYAIVLCGYILGDSPGLLGNTAYDGGLPPHVVFVGPAIAWDAARAARKDLPPSS